MRVTVPDTVAPAAGAVTLTVGAVVSLATVTLTAGEVVVLPAASQARAVSVWAPLVAVAVFHDTPQPPVELVSSATRLAPSMNCTPVTPTLSEAVAVSETVPDTVAPLAGAVTLTVGAVLSTVTVTVAEVVVVAGGVAGSAVSVWAPLVTVVVFHDTL